MPGLSQLKQFSKDLLSLGDEITIRASRGEKPVSVEIPKEIEDINDSEEFVLGMPEIEAEIDNTPIDEDLSDLAGLANPTASSSDSGEAAPAAFEAPDLSSLLNPINIPDDASAGADMPDLSMFEEEEVVEEEIVEEEPEEISIADMGLDALLSGGGFDAPEEEPEPEPEPLNIDDFKEVEDLDAALAEPVEEPVPDDGLTELERDLMASMGVDAIPSETPDSETDANSLDQLLGNIGLGPEEPLEAAGETDVEDIEPLDSIEPVEELSDVEDIEPLEDLADVELPAMEDAPAAEAPAAEGGLDSFGLDDMDFGAPAEDLSAEDIPAAEEFGSEDLSSGEEFAAPSLDDFNLDNIADIPAETAGESFEDIEPLAEEIPEADDAPAEDAPAPAEGGLDSFGLDDIDFGAPAEDLSAEDVPAAEDAPAAEGGLDSFGLDDMDFGAPAEDLSTEDVPAAEDAPAAEGGLDSFGLDDMDFGAPAEDLSAEDIPAAEDFGSEDLNSGEEFAAPSLDDFNLDNIADIPAETAGESFEDIEPLAEEISEADDAPAEETPAAEGGLDSFGLDDMDFGSPAGDLSADDIPASEDAPAAEGGLDSFSLDDMDFGSPAGDLSAEDMPAAEDAPAAEGGLDSFSLDDMDFGSADVDTPVSFDAEDEIPDYEDSNIEADGGLSDDFDSGDENQPLEVFDTSEMEGMDFGIQDTDAQLGGGDFELGNNDDFAMEGEFEIPGFSDVTTAKEEKSASGLVTGKDKKGKGKNLPEPDFSDAEESEDLPPNTLSDAQYKQFLKNLGEYPLNVRLAFEDLIVQDEFTDDAEFEVIEKILNKAPARQVASMLEKMLDTSIPVPRDFEHRTAEEYEAYKKSLSYQLKNKIIPGALVCIALMFVAWGIFTFSKNCIYKPLKANKLYKQGYALLEADEYPQSEMKFEEAVTYRINKKWFFNYARGYREHRQYQRAGTMYQRILKYFKHDKAAGLEYADMEVNELANYERAEEIVRREVLDYHINDAEGILKLGDVFLEWGTEKDSDKLENAREQYATLIQLYGSTDLYMSRMMRYFIRTDNLRQVIQMQKTFDARPKALGAEDLTELSGYLLDKYYGTLAPADEYLRYEIEGLRGLLLKAVKADSDNPIALYNLSKYFIKSGETGGIESTLQKAIEKFNTIKSMKKRDIYKYIDSYRLLGEHYIDTTDYLQAQEQFAEGISLYTTERDNAGFEGNSDIGKMYEDMGNIKYIISGDYDEALMNYKYSVELENDSSSIRYRIGYIQYKNKNYVEALGSFMKAGDGNVKERNLLLAMANTLSLRGDDYAAQGYYNQLIDSLDREIAKQGMVFPQASVKDYDVVNTYLSAANNYGVTLYKLAKRTGNSALNAQAIVQFQQSLRAWDAMTRNQETMVRLGGSNLAEQNIQYITHPIPEFEPSIYTDIAKTLLDNEKL